MDAVRRAVLQARLDSKNDDALVTELNNLVPTYGQPIFQCIFHIFTGLELSTQTAQDYWIATLIHRDRISKVLGRSIDLLPSMYDFLASSDHALKHPRLLEESSYSKVILETTHDGLTSLLNRSYFDQIFEQTVSSAIRYNNDITLLFLDIDNFKDINDTYGHKAGDVILQHVAQIITNEKRDSDIAARYGGEEFVLLMPHTSVINGLVLAERIRKTVDDMTITFENNELHVTVSGGIVSYPQNCTSHHELLRRADSALYLAKGSGKNNISMYKAEKRRYLRVKYTEPIQVKELGLGSLEIFSCTSKDICIGGILFENNKPFPLGSRIEVNIPMQNNENLILIGTVVRVEAFGNNSYDIGMAMSFKEMEKIANKEIANFLHNTTEKC